MSKLTTYKFEPLAPVRHDTPDEPAFVNTWYSIVGGDKVEIELQHLEQDLACDEEDDFYNADERNFFRIMHTLPRIPTPRDAVVATSFVRWLGTNFGHSFLSDASGRAREGLHTTHHHREAYMAAWGKANLRERHSSVARERVLASANQDYGIGTTDDLDTMEVMVAWLATDGGQEFLQKALASASGRRPKNIADNERRYLIARPV